MDLAPIVLFVYNRPDLTKETLSALKKNTLASESELFIFSDGSKSEKDFDKVNEVRKLIKNINGFKSVRVFENKENKGLANSIIFGVTKIINKYGKIIVLEDDLITSKYFLKFMNEGLNFYKNNKKIGSITGYNKPSHFMKFKNYDKDLYLSSRFSSWGWATWKDR